MTRPYLRPLALALVLPCMAYGQQVSATVGKPGGAQLQPLPRGQVRIDITTLTRHPANLLAQNLRTPEGVNVAASQSIPENATTCARAAASQSECRQTFRVTLDAGARCHVGGRYQALFSVACWPGTAASLCQPRAYQFEFNLGSDPICNLTPPGVPPVRTPS